MLLLCSQGALQSVVKKEGALQSVVKKEGARQSVVTKSTAIGSKKSTAIGSRKKGGSTAIPSPKKMCRLNAKMLLLTREHGNR